jgi:hypothetical protein
MEQITDRTAGLTHPDFPDTFMLMRDDGSIEIRAGKSSILLHPDGMIIIQAGRARVLADSFELNEYRFNEEAVNPSEPALLKEVRSLLPSQHSIGDYGD